MLSDAEVIKATVEALEHVPAVAGSEFVLRISHTRLLDAVLAACNVDPARRPIVLRYLHDLPKVRRRSGGTRSSCACSHGLVLACSRLDF